MTKQELDKRIEAAVYLCIGVTYDIVTNKRDDLSVSELANQTVLDIQCSVNKYISEENK